MSFKQEVHTFFDAHLTTQRRYSFTYQGAFHLMDSSFIVAQILESSEDELSTIAEVIVDIDPSQDNIHHFLFHLATIYIMGNAIHSN